MLSVLSRNIWKSGQLINNKLLFISPRQLSVTSIKLNGQKPPLVPLSSIDPSVLGHSILHLKENGAEATPTDTMKKGVIAAKMFSISSSSLGIIMIPVLTNYLWIAASERPGMMVITILANGFLALLTFTPLLLHFLVKRFVANIYYNHDTKIYTSVHYNFFLRKMAMQFKAEDVKDGMTAPEAKKLYIPLATAFIHGKPLLLSLDKNQYRDVLAFEAMTKNIEIPHGAD
uniref:Transmembrane protein 70 homolog, mitochondrial n=1 Tax=Rhabditophanes sp. KR3021 TaxID=114890 RepID=A0AC35TSX9_9BILA